MNIEMTTRNDENPFPKTKDTDILFYVEKHQLHLHKDILAIYSPVLKEKLNGVWGDPEILVWEDKHVEDLIDFLKFFYPHLRPRLTDNSNFTGLLELCKEYQVNWLTKRIDEYLSFSNIYVDNKTNINTNLHGLIMADQYKLTKLRAKLLAFRHTTSIENLHDVEGFEHLSEETIFQLNMQRLAFIVNSGESCIIRTALEEIYYAKNKKEQPQDSFSMLLYEEPFPEDENTDVIVKVGNKQLHLHSPVLSLYSSTFKKLLKQSCPVNEKQVIEMNSIHFDEVVEMFMFLYADKFQRLSDDTNISVLLSLCKEYQIHWLTHHVEEYLVSSRKYNFGCQNNLEGLKIAEEFDLATLKSIILNCRLGSLEELRQFAEYEHLSENTKYELARKEILRLKNVQLQNECMKMIGYLDEIFLK